MMFTSSRAPILPGGPDRALAAWQDAIIGGWFRAEPGGTANVMTVLATAMEIASGMAFLHSRDIVHGDLSSGGLPGCPNGSGVKGASDTDMGGMLLVGSMARRRCGCGAAL